MLYLSESDDANCSSTTKYVSKLVKDFLDEPLEKNSDFEFVRLSPREDFILIEFFNTWIPLRMCVKSFFIRCKDVLCPKGLSDAHFPKLVFLKGINNFFLLVL